MTISVKRYQCSCEEKRRTFGCLTGCGWLCTCLVAAADFACLHRLAGSFGVTRYKYISSVCVLLMRASTLTNHSTARVIFETSLSCGNVVVTDCRSHPAAGSSCTLVVACGTWQSSRGLPTTLTTMPLKPSSNATKVTERLRHTTTAVWHTHSNHTCMTNTHQLRPCRWAHRRSGSV